MGLRRRKMIIWVLVLVLLMYVSVPVAVAYMAHGNQVTSVGKGCMVARARHTLSFIPKRSIVCEIGVGRGILAEKAMAEGYTVWGVDCDPTVFVGAGIHKEFVQYVPPLPEFTEKPDAIVIESVIEHLLGYRDTYDLLEQCFDALPCGGVCVIRAPEIKYATWRFWDSAEDHTYVTSLRRLATIAHECGFEHIESGYYLDQFVGYEAMAIYRFKSLWPWQALHSICYEPWRESAFSKIAEKVPAFYLVVRKGSA